MKINDSILIIGPPRSGKTTFLAQLYTRIQDDKGELRLTKTPENIEGLLNACNQLAAGKEIDTTPADENVEIVIPVRLADKKLDLVCKDYGGEQIRNITHLLEYDDRWSSRAKSNDRWILFIRPGEIYNQYDLSQSGFAERDDEKRTTNIEGSFSDQYHFIELLQSLLHARGTSIKTFLKSPKLLVVLTCWDELDTNDQPVQTLTKRMPLFHHFVHTLWEKDSYKVIGLSAQHFPIDNDEARDKYLNELPETFGYLVLEDIPEEQDLTRLIQIALDL